MNDSTKSVTFTLLITLLAAGCGTEAPRSITAVSWGGSYGQAVNEAVNIPFAEEMGINVGVED